MIYQCYFAPEQKSRLFDSPLYRGFGLEPVVNPDITKNCPELADPETRLFLLEYAAFLYLWRNLPDDGDDWIGFTSYRQLDKFPTILTDKAQTEAELKAHDILGWGFYELIEDSTQKRMSIADFSEGCHPGITAYLKLVLSRFDREIPEGYFANTQGLFANYWLMSKKLFNDYMEWSWPMVKWGLDHRSQYAYIQSHPKSIGQAMERFFIIWYIQNQLKLKNVGEKYPLYLRTILQERPGQPAWGQSAAGSSLVQISFVIAVHREDKYRRARACLERLGVTDIVAIRDASSLSAAYDEGGRRARNEIICFLHQDAEIQSFNTRLVFEKFKDPTTGFLGVAGTRLLDRTGVWWQGLNTPQQAARLSGCCGHQTKDRRWVTEYGPFGEVVVLDGVLLISTKTVLKEIGGFADPPLNDFDFYDLSATFRARLKGYHNYTIPVDLFHWGLGKPRPGWDKNREIFLRKYAAHLPYSVRPPLGVDAPLVSIITPCHNDGGIIHKALECVRRSTYKHVEHIVVDDGSTGETPEILKALQQEYDFILLTLPSSQGAAAARNKGIAHSQGKYILPLDCDNYFSNNYIEELVRVAKAAGEGYSPFYTHAIFFGAVEGRVKRPQWSLERLLAVPFIDVGSLFSREAVEVIGGFDEQAPPLEDYEFFLRMALHGFEGVLVEGPALFYNVRAGSLSDHFGQGGGGTKKEEVIRYIFDKHRSKLVALGHDVDAIVERIIRRAGERRAAANVTLQTALTLHQHGDLDGAIAQYKALLVAEPENTTALANLASILKQVGRPEEALVRYRRALALDDSLSEVWFNFANLLQQQDHFAKAEDAYRQAIARNPHLYPAHFNLGNLLRDLDRTEEAKACYRETLRLRPDLARVHTNLGNLLRGQGQVEEAIVHHRQAAQLTPDDPDVHHNLGNALREAGEEEAAEEAYRQALVVAPRSVAALVGLARFLQATDRADKAESMLRRAVDDQPREPRLLRLLAESCYKQERFAEAQELYQCALAVEPDHADTHNAVGVVLQALGQTDEAVACWERAIALRPEHASAHNNLGAMYRMLNRHKEAIDHLRTAVRLVPDMPEAQVHLSYALLEVGQISEGVAIAESVVVQQPDSAGGHLMLGFGLAQQARIAESLAALQESQRLSPEANIAISNTLFAVLYSDQHDAAVITDLHRELAGRIVPSGPVFEHWDTSPDPDRSLRVGYLSPDLRSHPVGYFLEPILAHHRADQVDVVCYADVAVPDETTARLRKLSSTWHNCHGWPDDRLAEQIRADGVDILVDLVGHTAGNRAALLARKPAPIQMLYLGYPCTSGLPAIDYVIADRWVVPKNLAHLYTENVLALEGCFLCYQPQPDVPEVAPLPALANGYVTFGSYNNSPKLSATTVGLWAEVLHAVPRSRLALKTLAFRDVGTRALFADRFEAQGIARERVDLLPPTTPLPQFMAEYRRIDVALDSIPYNGGATTCDALWMGVPVITLPGEHFFGRMGLSVLQAASLPELVAETPADYVRIAAELAGDVDRLTDLRATMRARLTASPLCDGPGFIQQLEAAYRDAWRKWCS